MTRKWALTAYMRNVFDKRYSCRQMTIRHESDSRRTYGEPRVMGLTLGYKY